MRTEGELIGIYREQMRPLYAYVSRRVAGDRTLAEDIVQDTWLRAVASWPRRGIPDRPRAWLIRVASNLLVTHFRRRRPIPVDPVELDLEEGRCEPETPSAATLVNWGLARLSRRQAVLLEAFYFEGRSTREIAEERGLSERAIEGRLRRARQNLENKLQPYIDSGASGRVLPTAERLPESSEGRRNDASHT